MSDKKVIVLLLWLIFGSWIGICQAQTWGWKSAQTPDDVMNFLNGTGAYRFPVKDAKISLSWQNGRMEFTIFYRPGDAEQPKGQWGWKRSQTPNDMMNFISGTGAYRYPVRDAKLCGAWKGNYLDFYVFYQRDTIRQANSWGWKLATSPQDAVNFLNGAGAYTHGIKAAKIATIWKSGRTEYYIFYQRGSPDQPQDNWQLATYTQPDQVMALLNNTNTYPAAVQDGKIVSSVPLGSGQQFHIFKPQGFLIVTRPLFENTLPAYIQWKQSLGFEVYVVTAEWLDAHVNGANLRLKLRNGIRYYNQNAGVRYALLIGDSVDIPMAPDADTYQEPEPPTLSETWNLPPGYYRWDVWNFPQFTSLYYADLADKVQYAGTEYYWDGNYAIKVGIVPVRTVKELQSILDKTMSVQAADKMTFVISASLYNAEAQQTYQAVQTMALAALTPNQFIFDATAAAATIYSKLFEQPGLLYESGHGNVGIFIIGNTVVNNAAATKFQYVNPLFITSSCSVQAYYLGECLDEAFLKAAKGPAVVMTGPPWGKKAAGQILSDQERGFWQDLFNRKTIGQAFYDHCQGTWQNPHCLFGDPSLVMVKRK